MFAGAAVSTAKVNQAFFYILGACLLLLVLIMVVMILFVVKYRRGRHPKSEAVRESTLLEVGWTVLPVFLVMAMFYFGWVDFEYIRHPPADSMKVRVIGRQWAWLFRYADGREADVLRVPAGRPVNLVMTSLDVIHSFFIPAFRIKEDCVPGMTTHLWFQADELGTYNVFCTEYCGVGHSHMRTRIIVLPAAEFDRWYARPAPSGPAAEGLALLRDIGCLGCHSTDGTPRVGPTYKGLLGRTQEVITDGRRRRVTVDEGYVAGYIANPNLDLIPGYEPIMPRFSLTRDQVEKILAYLRTIK
jgi:cytochrome c oxidase subunit 2